MIENILLDMDGVVAEFTTGAMLAHQTGVAGLVKKPEDMDVHMPRGVWSIPDILGITETEFWSILDNEYFWEHEVPCIPGAKDFVKALNELRPVTFCTVGSNNPGCASAKVRWLREHIGYYPVSVLMGGAQKPMFANPTLLLVDDNDKFVGQYQDRGGPTVLVPRPWNEKPGENNGSSFIKVDYEKILCDVKNIIKESEEDEIS